MVLYLYFIHLLLALSIWCRIVSRAGGNMEITIIIVLPYPCKHKVMPFNQFILKLMHTVDPVLTEVRYSFAQVQPVHVHVIMLPDHVDYMYNLFTCMYMQFMKLIEFT